MPTIKTLIERDGAVHTHTMQGKKFTFVENAHGDKVCTIHSRFVCEQFISTGNYAYYEEGGGEDKSGDGFVVEVLYTKSGNPYAKKQPADMQKGKLEKEFPDAAFEVVEVEGGYAINRKESA